MHCHAIKFYVYLITLLPYVTCNAAPMPLQVAEVALALASGLLEEHLGDGALGRGVAELMAAASCIAGDNLAIKQVGWV
jgi:hypothetical protein